MVDGRNAAPDAHVRDRVRPPEAVSGRRRAGYAVHLRITTEGADVMEMATRMLAAHPKGRPVEQVGGLIAGIMSCEATCLICADACLSERDVTMLAECIALNYDCSEVCSTTARMLARPGHMQPATTRAQLEACREACRVCAEECETHEHEHCRICAEECRRCERTCAEAMEGMLASV